MTANVSNINKTAMELQQTIELENAVHSRGFNSVSEFALQKIKDDILKDMQESLQILGIYEKKYGMNYQEFFEKFHQITQFELLEKEDDGMEWRAESEVLRINEKRLAKLL
ncbi:hypothetical protein [Emticicia sp.]|uniref:hypothetical protein n=1 Tax=Emticicia sp. TaxID=1930953 RepID=UPI0037539253